MKTTRLPFLAFQSLIALFLAGCVSYGYKSDFKEKPSAKPLASKYFISSFKYNSKDVNNNLSLKLEGAFSGEMSDEAFARKFAENCQKRHPEVFAKEGEAGIPLNVEFSTKSDNTPGFTTFVPGAVTLFLLPGYAGNSFAYEMKVSPKAANTVETSNFSDEQPAYVTLLSPLGLIYWGDEKTLEGKPKCCTIVNDTAWSDRVSYSLDTCADVLAWQLSKRDAEFSENQRENATAPAVSGPAILSPSTPTPCAPKPAPGGGIVAPSTGNESINAF